MYVCCVFEHAGAHRYSHSIPTRRSSDLLQQAVDDLTALLAAGDERDQLAEAVVRRLEGVLAGAWDAPEASGARGSSEDRKSTRLNSSHVKISYAVFCLKKRSIGYTVVIA